MTFAPKNFPLSDLAGLPGEELVIQGLEDARSGRETISALLVEIAAPRLRFSGIEVPAFPEPPALDAEIRLYRLLGAEHGVDAYSQYNAYLRRIISFGQALEGRVSRARAKALGEEGERG